jgi:hypothetical protein
LLRINQNVLNTVLWFWVTMITIHGPRMLPLPRSCHNLNSDY